MDALLQSVSPTGRVVLEDIIGRLSLYALTGTESCLMTIMCVHTPKWLQPYIWPPQPEWDITEHQAMQFINIMNGSVKNIVRTSSIPPPELDDPDTYLGNAMDYTGTVSIVSRF